MIDLGKNQEGVTILVARQVSETGDYLLLTKKSYKNEEYLDIRKWFQSLDGTYHPTKKGITLHKTSFAEAIAQGIMAEMNR